MSRISGVLRRVFGVVREHVGTDHLGNKYYAIPNQKSWTGRQIRAKRTMEPANPSEHQYTADSIPTQWDAWLRGRRKDPPSIEELMANENQREQIKMKAREVEEKDLALQTKEYQEGLVATPARTAAKGHAAATSFGREEISEEPVSTANTFQPGSWMPSPKK